MKFVAEILFGLVLVFTSCSGCEPDRLEEPPEPNTCLHTGEVCEFDEQCCTNFCASWSSCEDPHVLVPPDSGVDTCVPEQVDVALILDLSGSMNTWIDDVKRNLEMALPRIPPTTSVQVWATPPQNESGPDGTFFQITGPVTGREALEAIRDLDAGDGGLEATLDASAALIRSRSDWRFGTTIRAIVVVSDERPQSYGVTPRHTNESVCDLREGTDLLFVFSLRSASSWWTECWIFNPLSGLWMLPDLLVDPCSITPEEE